MKSLRLSWLGRFLNLTNESWQAIPNDSFNKYGGLPFLLKCNYDSKLLDKQPPLFNFIVKCWIILRNCVQVTLMSIEVNSFFGITRKSRKRINLYFEHIFLRKESVYGSRLIRRKREIKFLSFDDLQVKYNVHLNFLQYFQLVQCDYKLLDENSSRNCRNEKRPT